MKNIYTLLCFCFFTVSAFAQNESDFYTDYIELAESKNLVVDYGADGTGDIDDSDALNNAIAELTNTPNGGRIYIPAGTFYLTKIYLEDNIHIEVDKDAILKPTQDEWVNVDPENHNNYSMFYFTSNNDEITNVSFRCKQEGEKYTIDLRDVINVNVRPFQLNSANNFMLADFKVFDALTKFSSVTTGTSDHNGKPEGWYAPENGVIKNAEIYNAHYGYGLIQSQALSNCLFKNIWGDGGVTLRLETGYSKMNQAQIGGNFGIVARDIYCQNGNAALMVSPHETHNGTVDAANIETVNCGFAVRMTSGYTRYDDIGVGPGKYESVVIDNVKATYGITTQVKSKHFKYMPCELRHLISDDYGPDGESYVSPAVACVLNTASDEEQGRQTYPNQISNTEAIGFEYQASAIVSTEHVIDVCPEDWTITYEADGGSHNNPTNYTVQDADIILEPAVKDGYVFKGWYDNETFNDNPITLIQQGSAGNITLWAYYQSSTSVNDALYSDIKVYPNPFSDKFSVQLSSIEQLKVLEIYSLAGQKVYQQNISGHNHIQINIPTLSNGVYFILLKGDAGSAKYRVIKY